MFIYRTVLEVNYLFHAESVQNIYFKNTLPPPPAPLEIEWSPPYHPVELCLAPVTTQLQMGENDSYVFNLTPNICVSTNFIPKNGDLI